MNKTELLGLARQLLSLPTAPYHEHAVREFVIAHCRELGLRIELDRVGNVIARYKRGSAGASPCPDAPLVFVAHMDHPGFEALDHEHAEFLGGVPKELFKGARVRFYARDGVVRATITRVDGSAWPRRKLVHLRTESRKLKAGSRTLRKGDFGMWDVPAFRVRRGLLQATAVDDVLGVAVVLATLAEAARKKLPTHVWGAFTRAEEAGFHGAVELARSRKIPRGALVVSTEMSRERPWARIGNGPVVRVGDRMTTFDARATFFLQEVARVLRERDSAFRSQRCLMDGGMCEAMAFAAFGYRVGGLCLPLGNYHNVGRDGKVRAEYISVRDLKQLVQLTVEAAEQWRNFGTICARLQARVAQIRREALRKL